MKRFLVYLGILLLVILTLPLTTTPTFAACNCTSQMCTTSSCGTTCYGSDPSQCANGVSCYPFPYCICGYQGNGTCANPACPPTPITCEPGNCCDPTDVTRSTGSVCSASCGGTCNYWNNQTCGWTTASCNVPATSTVKGYKVLMTSSGMKYNNPSPPNPPPDTTTIDGQQISVDNNPQCSTPPCTNPYSITVGGSCAPGGVGNHWAYIPIPVGYSAGYTKCDSSQSSCTPDTPSNPNFYHSTVPTGLLDNTSGSGPVFGIVPVTTPGTSSFVDLWAHYCPNSNWQNVGVCDLPPGSSCGNGNQYQIDSCGNTRTTLCSVTCSFFQTYGGDVTAKGAVSNTELPASFYVSGRYSAQSSQSNRPSSGTP